MRSGAEHIRIDKLDMEYVKNWNIGMDIKILFKTVGVVLKGSGSK